MPARGARLIGRALSRALGPRRVLAGDRIPLRYRLDALRAHRGSRLPEEGEAPAAVVLPGSTSEVSAAVRIADRHGAAVIAWGGGTGLMGGARPTPDAVVLDLRGMRRIRSVDVASRTATAEAGIVLEDLDRRLRRARMALGHDPWSRPRATLGGAIATNGLGYAGYLRGSMGDQVLGLEVVLSDGTVLRTRAAARSTTGLDLKRLFIGTEGTLGIVTAATIHALPLPEREEIHAFQLPDFSAGFEAVSRLYDDGLFPYVMDLEEAFAVPGGPWPTESGPPELFLGFCGAAEVVGASWRVARAVLRGAGARPLPDREARAYWRGRHDIIYRMDEVAPGVTGADVFLKDVVFDYVHVALPRARVLPFRRSALAVLRRHGVFPLGVGLWTQPELVSIEMMRPVRGDRARARAAVAEAVDGIVRRAHATGGSMEYVHGVGVKLAHLMGEELGTGLEVYRRVKEALDPEGRLNPGKAGL